jgi:voltage-gated potassium channel
MMRAVWLFLRRPPILFKVAVIVVAALFYGASGFVYFERLAKPELTWADGFWWTMVTMATLGYGDFFPVTAGGRFLIAYPLMLLGMGFLALGMAQVAAFLLNADLLNRKGMVMSNREDHIVVCNFVSAERFALLQKELRAQPGLQRHAVVVIDPDLQELPSGLEKDHVQFVRGYAARAEALERANIARAARAVVLARNPTDAASDDTTTAICLTLKAVRPDLHVVAECVDPNNQETLRRAGCDSIVCVMALGPGILAQELQNPGVVQVLHELMLWAEDINNIFIVPFTLGASGQTVVDLRRWSEGNGAILLGVKSNGKVELIPKPTGRCDPGRPPW